MKISSLHLMSERYPKRLKMHLQQDSPNFIYCIGNEKLFDIGGLAVVGSRDISEKNKDACKKLGEICASEEVQIISGNARGSDYLSMDANLQNGGTGIVALSHGLEFQSKMSYWKSFLDNGKVLLISQFDPESIFSVNRAMKRNKVIYGLSDYAMVIHSKYNSGGTWAGVTEELKRDYPVPVFTLSGVCPSAGNVELVKLGAYEFPIEYVVKDKLKKYLNSKSGDSMF